MVAQSGGGGFIFTVFPCTGVTAAEGQGAETGTAAGKTEIGHAQNHLLLGESENANLALMSCHLVVLSQELALSLEWHQQQFQCQQLVASAQHQQVNVKHLLFTH